MSQLFSMFRKLNIYQSLPSDCRQPLDRTLSLARCCTVSELVGPISVGPNLDPAFRVDGGGGLSVMGYTCVGAKIAARSTIG